MKMGINKTTIEIKFSLWILWIIVFIFISFFLGWYCGYEYATDKLWGLFDLILQNKLIN